MAGGDTLCYRYTPIDTVRMEAAQYGLSDSVVSPVVKKKKPFFRRIIDYFGESSRDKTFEKKIDFTFIGGPNYSKETELGLGLMAAGLYRLDRTDSITSPSDVSIYATASTAGFYKIGVSGNNIFRSDPKPNYLRLVVRLATHRLLGDWLYGWCSQSKELLYRQTLQG